MSAAFVCRMEDVLDLYAEPYDPARPVVCLDEYPLALTAGTRAPIPLAPGRSAREDYEYARRGSCALFATFQPATGWRRVTASAQRTKREFAAVLAQLDQDFPDARVIRVVLDNLNTHTLAALYEHFAAAEARRLARRFELHFTPVHGSWLNLIEVEWSVLAQQCLDRRLPDIATVQREVDAWAAARNAQHATVRCRFTTPDARRCLHWLYPHLDPLAADQPQPLAEHPPIVPPVPDRRTVAA